MTLFFVCSFHRSRWWQQWRHGQCLFIILFHNLASCLTGNGSVVHTAYKTLMEFSRVCILLLLNIIGLIIWHQHLYHWQHLKYWIIMFNLVQWFLVIHRINQTLRMNWMTLWDHWVEVGCIQHFAYYRLQTYFRDWMSQNFIPNTIFNNLISTSLGKVQ